MTFDKFFWLVQPSSVLNNFDNTVGYFSAALIALSVLTWLAARFVKHKVVKKALRKFFSLFLTTGLLGLLWFGLRYENTPIFGRRYWVIVLAALMVVWLAYVLRYLFTTFRAEKAEYDRQMINSRYL